MSVKTPAHPRRLAALPGLKCQGASARGHHCMAHRARIITRINRVELWLGPPVRLWGGPTIVRRLCPTKTSSNGSQTPSPGSRKELTATDHTPTLLGHQISVMNAVWDILCQTADDRPASGSLTDCRRSADGYLPCLTGIGRAARAGTYRTARARRVQRKDGFMG
jgi:hypothetical protein